LTWHHTSPKKRKKEGRRERRKELGREGRKKKEGKEERREGFIWTFYLLGYSMENALVLVEISG
jgi:hypothetical protein